MVSFTNVLFRRFYALVLLVLFVWWFGYDSIHQFSLRKTHMVTEILKSDGSDFPTPTVLIIPRKMFVGGRDDYSFYNKTMKCIREKNKPYECLGKSRMKIEHDNTSIWTTGINLVDGWFYRRMSMLSFKEGAKNLSYQSILYSLNNSRVYILDQNDFPMSLNAFKSIHIGDHNKDIFISVKRVIKMESNGCNNDINYSFGECILGYINRLAGCKLEHLDGGDPVYQVYHNISSVPPCVTVSQVEKYLDIVTDIRLDFTNLMLIEKSGCQPNCVVYRYKVQKVVDWVSAQYWGFGFWLSWIDGEIVQETEKYEYTGLTLVANLGGLLGLFLGFSFLMLWDSVLQFYNACKNSLKNHNFQ